MFDYLADMFTYLAHMTAWSNVAFRPVYANFCSFISNDGYGGVRTRFIFSTFTTDSIWKCIFLN